MLPVASATTSRTPAQDGELNEREGKLDGGRSPRVQHKACWVSLRTILGAHSASSRIELGYIGDGQIINFLGFELSARPRTCSRSSLLPPNSRMALWVSLPSTSCPANPASPASKSSLEIMETLPAQPEVRPARSQASQVSLDVC